MIKNKIILCLLAGFIALSCVRKEDDVDCSKELFGRPFANTGLSVARCTPNCKCKNFTSRLFTPEEIAGFKSWKLKDSIPELTINPYTQPIPESRPCVCAVKIEDKAQRIYSLETYDDEESAKEAGAIVTHYDSCGKCSTLEDLAVFAGNLDVGKPVKECGLQNFNEPFEKLVECIMEIGFTKPCAQIWAYNVRNTQAVCLRECLGNEPYHNPDGSLSPCLQCDEDKSGPVYKAVAGRTRRNTGIASSICRPCNEVQPIQHKYE
jgi:hypothetical protein